MTIFCVCRKVDTEVGERGVMLSGGKNSVFPSPRVISLDAEILILMMRCRRWMDARSTRSCITCASGEGANGNYQRPSPVGVDGSQRNYLMQHGAYCPAWSVVMMDWRYNKAGLVSRYVSLSTTGSGAGRRPGNSRGGRRCVVLPTLADPKTPAGVRFSVA